MIRSFSITTIILLCLALFEATILSNLFFLPAVPDLLMICVMYVSIQNGRLYGVGAGFVSGLFLDFLSASPFGFNCLLRTILGYICGLFNKVLNIDGFIVPFATGIGITIGKVLLVSIISILFPTVGNSYYPFTIRFLFELVFNGVLTPLVFMFLNIFSKYLILSPEQVS